MSPTKKPPVGVARSALGSRPSWNTPVDRLSN